MAIVQSKPSSDLLTIDPTSKAARMVGYDSDGDYIGQKKTYRGCNGIATYTAAAGTGIFFVIGGSASRTIMVTRLQIMEPTLTAVQYLSVMCRRYSTRPTGGTTVGFSSNPMDRLTSPIGTLTILQGYSAAPTAGVVIGALGNRRVLAQATTAVAAGNPPNCVWDFRDAPIRLRGADECLTLAFGAAPATAVTLCVEVEWLED